MTTRSSPWGPFETEDMDRWPQGTRSVELDDGHLIFYGAFGPGDQNTAEQVYPGRRISIEIWGDGKSGNLIVHHSACQSGTCPLTLSG